VKQTNVFKQSDKYHQTLCRTTRDVVRNDTINRIDFRVVRHVLRHVGMIV
jgi:hypothetical protein